MILLWRYFVFLLVIFQNAFPLYECYFIPIPEDFKSTNPTTVYFSKEKGEYQVSVFDSKHSTYLDVVLDIHLNAEVHTAEFKLTKYVVQAPCNVSVTEGDDTPYGLFSLQVTVFSQKTHLFSLYEDGKVSGDISPSKLHGDAVYNPNDKLYILPTLEFYFPCPTKDKPEFPCHIFWDKTSALYRITLKNGFVLSGHESLRLDFFLDSSDASVNDVAISEVALTSRLTLFEPYGKKGSREFAEVLICLPEVIWYKVIFFNDGRYYIDPDTQTILADNLIQFNDPDSTIALNLSPSFFHPLIALFFL